METEALGKDTKNLPVTAANGDVATMGSGESQQFITFTIGEEEYGVDIMVVREIKGWAEPTALPNSPEHMRGVLNLRGVIVPIFDLRCRFGQGMTEVTKLHVFIIVAVNDRLIGILVDSVSDILSVSDEDIRPVPKMERQIDSEYLNGLVTVKERMVALLDTVHLFNIQDLDVNTTGVEVRQG